MIERPWHSFALERLGARSTYRVAAIVGTFINFYGHALVPWLRGHDDVLNRFFHELTQHTATVVFSIVLAYVFPIAVGVYSSAKARRDSQSAILRADFPDQKPDPVFRATEDGQIFEAGQVTWDLLTAHEIRRAQQLLGDDMWAKLVATHRNGNVLPPGTEVHCGSIDRSFLVAHAPSSCGAINVYLTEAPRTSV